MFSPNIGQPPIRLLNLLHQVLSLVNWYEIQACRSPPLSQRRRFAVTRSPLHLQVHPPLWQTRHLKVNCLPRVRLLTSGSQTSLQLWPQSHANLHPRMPHFPALLMMAKTQSRAFPTPQECTQISVPYDSNGAGNLVKEQLVRFPASFPIIIPWVHKHIIYPLWTMFQEKLWIEICLKQYISSMDIF